MKFTPKLSSRADAIIRKIPFFYGWVMLPIAIIGQIVTSPGQTYGISVFNESIQNDLKLTATQLTGAYMLGTLLACLPMSLVGVLMDRYGIRRAMTLVVLLFGLTCLATSQVEGMLSLFLAFFMLRMLGQGALSLLCSNTLAMWFHDRLGTVSGVMNAATALAIAVIPGVNLFLVSQHGWRTAYVILGVAVWVIMLPLLALFYRNRPEDIGQSLDGTKPEVAIFSAEKTNELHKWSLNQAMKTRAYWILLAMNMVWALVCTGIMFNIVVLFKSRGLSENEVGLFFLGFALSLAVMQFIGGFLADRFRATVLLFISLSFMTSSLVYYLYVDSINEVVCFAMLFGGSQGIFGVVGQTLWPRYFGRANLGKIRSTIWTGSVAGSSLGPFIMGLSIDYLNSYDWSLYLFIALYALLTAMALFATKPIFKVKSNSAINHSR